MTSKDRDGPMSERVFGVLIGCVLSGVGALPLVSGGAVKPIPLSVGIALLSSGVLCPSILYWPKRIWFSITHRIAQVVNLILLGIVFFLLVTPLAIFLRMFGRDFLSRKLDPIAKSYWIRRTEARTPMEFQF